MNMWRSIAQLASGLVLAGCAATIPQAPGPAQVPTPLAFSGEYRPPPGSSDRWWTGFGDPALDALVEAALARNLDIAATRARLESSQALLRAARSDRLPTVDASGSAGISVADDGVAGLANVGLGASFDPDFSGRISAEIERAAASAAAAEYLVADRRRLVAASVAQQYLELRRSGERLRLLDESTKLQEQTLRIVTLRFEAGLSANLDVRRAAADLAQTRAQRGLLELDRARAAHALAILSGDAPGPVPPVAGVSGGVPSFAGGPPVGIPADLLRRRPDLLVAEARLVEAAALIGIERADLLPSLTIPGNLSVGSGSIGGILSQFVLSVGAALNLPLFDGGRRRAEVAAAESEAEARFAEYHNAFLEVLGEVENALVAIRSHTSRSRDLAAAIDESETAFGQSNALYREGLATLFEVLDAQRQLIANRQALIDSQADLAAAIVTLYSAVGAPVGT